MITRLAGMAILLTLATGLAGCEAGSGGFAPASSPGFLTLRPGGFGRLAGWRTDHVAAAVPAFLRSCARFLRRADGAPLDPSAPNAAFGRVGDWRPLCHAAASLPPCDDAAARRFFERNFVPVRVGNSGDAAGLVTGYWETALNGARVPQGPYRIPVYRRPPSVASLRASRDSAFAARAAPLVYLASRADLARLETQGSGRIRLTDGSVMRLDIDAGSEPPHAFFHEVRGRGPIGAEGVVLTPGRSLAVDHHYIPLGVPLWLDAEDQYRPVGLHRLVIAQDTGNGIDGPVRGDFYFGSGSRAHALGRDFYATGGYYLLLPRTVALR